MAKLSRRERRLLKQKLDKKKVQEAKPIEPIEQKPDKKPIIQAFFDNNFKKLVIIPLLILVISFIVLGIGFARTGEVVQRDVSLKGGITLTVQTELDLSVMELEQNLRSKFEGIDINSRAFSRAGKQIGFLVTADIDIDEKETIDSIIKEVESFIGISLTEDNYSIEFIGSTLGASFFNETLTAILVAFIFMGIVVFITFKRWVPSCLVIMAAFSDIVATLAVVNLLGIKLSTAGIAAFLMLIGYSVDTDIMLTTRVLKREKGTVSYKIRNAMKTGLAMSLTSLTAVVIAFIFTPSEILKQIMLILAIGLLFDMIYTWFFNAGILRWWLEIREKRGIVEKITE